MALVISKKHKYIFFHIPKNAGVSISRALILQETSLKIKRLASFFLRNLHIGKDNFYYSLKDLEFIFFNSHITCYNFYKIFNKKNFDNYFKFAVVRNPWERAVSRYFYSKKINKKFAKLSFNEFVDYDIKNNIHVLNQYKFCTKDEERFCLNDVIKFEDIHRDFNKISLNIFGKVDLLKHLNKTEHKNYRNYYDNILKDKIYKNLKDDINFFKYEY